MSGKIGGEFQQAPNGKSGRDSHDSTPREIPLNLDDGRSPFEWKSKYPDDAKSHIRIECTFLCLYLIFSFFVLFANYRGCTLDLLSLNSTEYASLRRYIYYSIGGLLGGTIFGMKWFYRLVARGYWHLDRRIWRFLMPFIALTLAFIFGVMIDAGLIPAKNPESTPTIVGIGFIVGYFADKASAKLFDVANVLFGTSEKHS